MPFQVIELLNRNIADSIEAIRALKSDAYLIARFGHAIEHVVECYRSEGRLYIAGNGGSAADAQHLAAEFVSRLARERNPLPAEAITTDSSILTAIGNDYGYEHIFSRQLAAKLKNNDVFLGITTSGKSKNILNALEYCKARDVKTIVFTGHDGGLASVIADFPIIAPGNRTSTIQEVHIILGHTLCEAIETALFPP